MHTVDAGAVSPLGFIGPATIQDEQNASARRSQQSIGSTVRAVR